MNVSLEVDAEFMRELERTDPPRHANLLRNIRRRAGANSLARPILLAYDELMANCRRRIRRGVQKPLSGAWMTPGTPITPDHKKCPQSERKARKNKRISSTNSSGSSSAGKWPPRDISVQCWILNPRSTQRLGGNGPSRFGKRAIPHGTVT